MLHGTQLYGSQLDETNPPLIIWFSAIPAALSNLTHIYALTVLRAFITLLIALSTAWCLRILRAAGLARNLALTSLWTLALLALEVSQHGNDFGQKEQVLILFLLPLLFYEAVQHTPATAASPRLQFGLPERIALGICAGLSVSFKPQDALILVAFELFLLLLYTRNPRRLLRAELLAAVLTGLAYIAAVRLFAPLYFSDIVPLLSDTYWAFGEYTTLEVLRRCPIFNLLCLLNLIAWVILRKRLRYPAAPLAFLAGAAGAALAYAMQNKDWPYQFFPQQAILCCAIAWLLFDTAAPFIASRLHRARYLLPLALLIAAVTTPRLYTIGDHHDRLVSQTPDSAFLDSTLAALPPGTPVTLLSINLMGDNDILRGNLSLATRYHHLWMLPSIILNERAQASHTTTPHPVTPTRLAYLANLQRSNSAEDIRTHQPAVIIVQHCKATDEEPCQGLYGTTFDILPWFLQSPDFAAAFTPYHRTSGDTFFDIYTRTP